MEISKTDFLKEQIISNFLQKFACDLEGTSSDPCIHSQKKKNQINKYFTA